MAGRGQRKRGRGMTDGEDLLRAIVATPEDDAPRLVYADWLDEHGVPDWAEFIRVQVELAATPGTGWRVMELTQRELVLIQTKAGRFMANTTAWVTEPVFRRGFLEEARVYADVMDEHGADLLRRHPLLHRVILVWASRPGRGPPR